jgi:hypothetical protein
MDGPTAFPLRQADAGRMEDMRQSTQTQPKFKIDVEFQAMMVPLSDHQRKALRSAGGVEGGRHIAGWTQSLRDMQ